MHAIPNAASFVDYDASVATGGLLTYHNPTNASGVTIDGVPDPGMHTVVQHAPEPPAAAGRRRCAAAAAVSTPTALIVRTGTRSLLPQGA